MGQEEKAVSSPAEETRLDLNNEPPRVIKDMKAYFRERFRGVNPFQITQGPLYSVAPYLQEYCKKESDMMVQCHTDYHDNRFKCKQKAMKLLDCFVDLLLKMENTCQKEYVSHWTCLDYNGFRTERCRKFEKGLSDCMFEKLGLNAWRRPYWEHNFYLEDPRWSTTRLPKGL